MNTIKSIFQDTLGDSVKFSKISKETANSFYKAVMHNLSKDKVQNLIKQYVDPEENRYCDIFWGFDIAGNEDDLAYLVDYYDMGSEDEPSITHKKIGNFNVVELSVREDKYKDNYYGEDGGDRYLDVIILKLY